MTLARNLTWPDIIELSLAQRQMVESIIARLRPALQTFVIQRLLQGEAPSEESIARACERVYSEMRPYLDVMVIFFLCIDFPTIKKKLMIFLFYSKKRGFENRSI